MLSSIRLDVICKFAENCNGKDANKSCESEAHNWRLNNLIRMTRINPLVDLILRLLLQLLCTIWTSSTVYKVLSKSRSQS